MGHIQEPNGVDFYIKSPPLTEKEKEELSEHIRKRKLELRHKSESKRKTRANKKSKL